MKTNHFQNTVKIQSPVTTIFAYLTDSKNLISLHPLIINVQELISKEPNKKRLLITDKIPLFGFIPFYKKYEATLEIIEPNHSLVLETFTSPKIHIQNTITLTHKYDYTLVQEKTLVETPNYIEGFVLKQIKLSHTQMLTRLKQHVETSS